MPHLKLWRPALRIYVSAGKTLLRGLLAAAMELRANGTQVSQAALEAGTRTEDSEFRV
jgi:hypothetical protein